jgi:thymidylate kinase
MTTSVRLIRGQARLISFSGIDGAGKSTQIARFCDHMKAAELRFLRVEFWNDIAMFTRFREAAAFAAFRGDRGVGTPSAPINRRDKNVRSPLMTCLRMCLYLADAISAALMIRRVRRSDADVVIFDRFIYDELANLNLRNYAIRAYVRLIAKLVPAPHVAYLLDADPAQARARKPEYPLDFLADNRSSYLALSRVVGGLTVIPPMAADEVEREVLRHAQRILSLAPAHNAIGAARDSASPRYNSTATRFS